MSVRLAAYVRVSKATGEQTVENQRPDIEAWAARHKLTVARWYEEEGSAAKKRPVFEAMMRELRARKFDRLIVWALDRFGRTFREGVVFTCDLEERGVLVHSVKEEWLDATGPFREPLRGLMFKIAEQERSRLIERTNAGLARARAEGIRLGRDPIPEDAFQVVAQLVKGGASVEDACEKSSYRTRGDELRYVSPASFYRWQQKQRQQAAHDAGVEPDGINAAGYRCSSCGRHSSLFKGRLCPRCESGAAAAEED